MLYSKSTGRIVELLNSLLGTIGQDIIENNKAMHLYDVNWENYVKIDVKTEYSVLMNIEISDSGMSLGIDHFEEAFSWGLQDIIDNHNEIFSMLKMLLTSFVEVKSYGKKYKIVSFINSDGKKLYVKTLINGVFSNIFAQKIETYKPIFQT